MLPFVVALSVVSTAFAGPGLSGPEGSIGAGVAASFTFVTDAGGLFVDGCEAVELERRENDQWTRVSVSAGCDGSAVARAVSGKLAFSMSPPSPGEYRGVLVWGKGCAKNLPFALAACSAVGVVRSEPFVVVQR